MKEESRPNNHKIINDYNSNPNSIKKSKSIGQLRTINHTNNKKQTEAVVVKNSKINKDEENIFALLNLHKEEEYPHLQRIVGNNKEKSLTPNIKKQNEILNLDRENRQGIYIIFLVKNLGLKTNLKENNKINKNKNFLEENKNRIQNKEVPMKSTKKDEVEPVVHRNFGKTPEYLQKYKQDAEDKKEFL